jgi:hypothetical protein
MHKAHFNHYFSIAEDMMSYLKILYYFQLLKKKVLKEQQKCICHISLVFRKYFDIKLQ